MSGAPREPRPPRHRIRLRVDGRPVALKPFLHDLIGGAVLGLVAGLRDCEDAARVELEVALLAPGDDDPGPA